MKTKLIVFVLPLMCFFAPLAVSAEEYVPMVKNIPFIADASGKVSIETFVPGIYKLAVGVASVIAVIVIILAGFKYMTSEGGKSAAKESIQNALLGLLMLLGSYLLLYTINPQLLNINLNLSTWKEDDFKKFNTQALQTDSYSGYTEELVTKIRAAEAKYNEALAAGDTETADEIYYDAVTDTNYEIAMSNVAGDAKSQQLAKESIARMQTYYDQQIEAANEEGNFAVVPLLEAQKIERTATFNQTAKFSLIEKTAAGATKGQLIGSTGQQILKEITLIKSEAEVTYQQLNSRDPAAAARFNLQTNARLDKIRADLEAKTK